MTYSLATVRPSSDQATGGWTIGGGSGSMHAALADDNDATYIEGSASVGATAAVGLATLSVSADQVQYLQPWIRAATSDSVARVVAVRLYGAGALQRLVEQPVSLDGTPRRYNLPPFRAWGNGRSFTDADLASLFVAFRETTVPVGSVRIYEVGVDAVYLSPPTVSLTSVTTPVTTSCLLGGAWSYSDAQGNAQHQYQERIYQMGNNWPSTGGSPGEQVAALEAAGQAPVNDVTVVTDVTVSDPILYPPAGTFRRYVRVSDETAPDVWGPWATQEWVMAVTGGPDTPSILPKQFPEKAAIDLAITPALASSVDELQVERSDDGGITWQAVHGTYPTLQYLPTGPNVINNGSFARDSNGDGLANDWSLYNTGSSDPAPTPTIIAAGQQVAYTTNTGRKGLTTRPRVAADESNIWPADTIWVLSLSWASDRNNNDMKPKLVFDGGSFTVTWQQNPTPGVGMQGYTAKIVVGGADVESDLHIYTDGPSGHYFQIGSVQLALAGQAGHEGYGTSAYGTDFYAGTNNAVDESGFVLAPPYRPREDTGSDITDRFVPRRNPTIYRAREVANQGSGAAWGDTVKTSLWAFSPSVTLESDGNAWLMSSSGLVPDLSLCQAGPDMAATAGQTQQTYWAEGRTLPIVVQGTVREETLDSVTLAFRDDAEFMAFRGLRALAEPLLLRTLYGEAPMEDHWIVVGDQVQTTRKGYDAGQQSQAQLRLATFAALPSAEPSVVNTPIARSAVVVSQTGGGTPPPPPPPPPTAPAAPNLISVVGSGTQLAITFDEPLGTEGYDIFVAAGAAAPVQVGWPQIFNGAGADGAPLHDNGNNTFTYTYTGGFNTPGPGLAAGTYTVTVAAYNALGVGAQSVAKSATLGTTGGGGGGGGTGTGILWGGFIYGASHANLSLVENAPGNFGRRDILLVHGNRGSWDAITNTVGQTLGAWAGDTRPVSFTACALPPFATLGYSNFGQICAAALTGAFDGFWTTQLRAIAALFPNAILRPFHEFNAAYIGEWYAVGFPTQYVQLFQHYVTLARSISSGFTFDWCILISNNGVDWRPYYPGAAFVDYHGCDAYNRNWTHGGMDTASLTARWNFVKGMANGMQAWIDFATLNGKKTSWPEWMNVNFPSAPSENSGDDTVYIDNMHDMIYLPSTNTKYHVPYFDSNPGANSDLIFDPAFAQSLVHFRAKFGV